MQSKKFFQQISEVSRLSLGQMISIETSFSVHFKLIKNCFFVDQNMRHLLQCILTFIRSGVTKGDDEAKALKSNQTYAEMFVKL